MNALEIIGHLSRKEGLPGTLSLVKTLPGEMALVSGIVTKIVELPVTTGSGKKKVTKNEKFEEDLHSLYLVFPKNHEEGFGHIEMEISEGPITITNADRHKHDNNVLEVKVSIMGKKLKYFFSIQSHLRVDEPRPPMRRRSWE